MYLNIKYMLLRALGETLLSVLPTHEFSFPPYLMEPPTLLGRYYVFHNEDWLALWNAPWLVHRELGCPRVYNIPVYTDGSKCATGVGFATVFPHKVISGGFHRPPLCSQQIFEPYSLRLRTCFGFLELSLSSTQTLKVPYAPLAILFCHHPLV